nr:MerR family transcriptional regulator [Lachnospiraceae bacterium]
VGEMSRLLDVAPSTLRYYDKEGLLPFVERSDSGIRIFKEEDMEWLQVISCLKRSGMQIKDIKSFIAMAMQGDETIDDRLRLFRKQRDAVNAQIAELEQTLKIVEFKCWYYEQAQQAGTTAVFDEISIEDIPPEHQKAKEMLCCKQNAKA